MVSLVLSRSKPNCPESDLKISRKTNQPNRIPGLKIEARFEPFIWYRFVLKRIPCDQNNDGAKDMIVIPLSFVYVLWYLPISNCFTPLGTFCLTQVFCSFLAFGTLVQDDLAIQESTIFIFRPRTFFG